MKRTSKRMLSLILAVVVVLTAVSVSFTAFGAGSPYYNYSGRYLTSSNYPDYDYSGNPYEVESNYNTMGDYVNHKFYITRSDYVTETDYNTGETYVTRHDYVEEFNYVDHIEKYTGIDYYSTRSNYSTGSDYSTRSDYVTRADYIPESYRYNDLYSDTITWYYGSVIITLNTRTGLMRISGFGAIPDFNNYNPPWCAYNYLIRSVVIDNRITGIGDNAFYGCYNIKDVYYNGTQSLSIGNNHLYLPNAVSFSLMMWPVNGFRGISAGFQSSSSASNGHHNGIDIAGDGIAGQPIRAIADGYVTLVSNSCSHNYKKSANCCGNGYGNYCVVNHGNINGAIYVAYYAHAERIVVENGAYVTQGQVLGYVGTTGWSTGYHLHLGIMKNNVWVNPYPLFFDSINYPVYYIQGEKNEESIYSGKCGDNVYWNLKCENNGLNYLTITGIGKIQTNYAMLSRLKNIHLSKVIISNGITSIDDYAFYELNISELELPSTLKRIGDYAFYRSGLYGSISIPASVEYIGKDAFRGTKIQTLLINRMYPDMYDILYGSFSGCTELRFIKLGSGITEIPQNAFFRCIGIEEIYSTDYDIQKIGDYAFAYCTTLKHLYGLSWENSIYIGNGAFYGCYKLKNLYGSSDVEYLGYEAFYKCFSLTDFSMPYSLETIQKGTFAYCKSLEINFLPFDVKQIEDCAFYGCESIKYLDTGYNLQYIGSGAFTHCENLSEIELPETLQYIGYKAFYYCSSLSDIYLSDSVLSISEFANKKITIYAPMYSNAYYFAIKSGYDFVSTGIAKTGTYNYNHNVWKYDEEDRSLSILFKYGFDYKESLPNVSAYTELPWHYYTDKVKSLYITDGIETIGENTFSKMVNLETVYLPDTIKLIKSNAFSDCRKLNNLVLPSGLMEIGKKAFYNCSSLANISIPDSLIVIDDYAFYRCRKLSEISLDGVVYIGNFAFSRCTNLKNIKLGKNLASIGECAFEDTDIESLFIPSGVSFIDYDAFLGNEDIELICQYGSNAAEIAKENLFNYSILGDFSGDGILDANDLSDMVGRLLEKNSEYSNKVDMNFDGAINILDLIAIKKVLSNQVIGETTGDTNIKADLKTGTEYSCIIPSSDDTVVVYSLMFYNDDHKVDVVCQYYHTEISGEELTYAETIICNDKTYYLLGKSGDGWDYYRNKTKIRLTCGSDIIILEINGDSSLTVLKSYGSYATKELAILTGYIFSC